MGPETDTHHADAGVDPPWTLQGEGFVALARRPVPSAGLPAGIDPMPGPSLVLAAHWHRTPVGPYRELAVLVPARVGRRPGWCVTTMVVDSDASRRSGRAHWGMPKELGRLTWRATDRSPGLRWDERAIDVRVGSTGRSVPALPLWAPVPLVQVRAGGPVAVAGTVRGRARPAGVEVAAPPDDPLAPLNGHHPGLHLPQVRLHLGPASPR